jgi:serine/threonine-protein kinase
VELEQFGPYRIEALLGRGETGEVHRAVDTGTGQEVALTVLSEALSADGGYRELFSRRAEAVARIDEPHVVPLHRAGEIDGRLYVAAPLVAGRDVAAVLAGEGPLEPARAVSVVSQTARALDAAAAVGVHGGGAPSDVVLTGSGDDERVQVTGLAVPPAPGTPSDERAAVPALATLLAACLTGGAAPAAGRTEQPSGVPEPFAEVVRRGLAADPAERYATPGDLVAAAVAALRASGSRSGPRRGAGRLRPVLAALAVLALLAAVLVVVLTRSGDDDGADPAASPSTTSRPGTVTPSAPPDDAAENDLRAIIPEQWVSVDCDPSEATGDGALAVLGCGSAAGQPGPEDSVFYLYADPATADDVFLADMERNDIAPFPDDAGCPDAQGYGTYQDEIDDHAGRLACYIDGDNNAVMAWTQDDVGAEAWVTIIDGGQPGLDALYAWWAYPEADTSGFVQR